MISTTARTSLLLFTAATAIGYAKPVAVTVSAQANIYGAGQASPPGGGELPPFIDVGGHVQCVTIHKVRGTLRHMSNATMCPNRAHCITLDKGELEGTHLNDPDGVGGYPPSSMNTGAGSISGITAPFAGYLVGLFVPRGGPAGSAPAALDFTTGTGTGFTTLAPLLDQTFFVGDGKTGDDSGTFQAFIVPAGAKMLYLGISDACGWNGAPRCYIDNAGSFTLTVRTHIEACSSLSEP